MYARFIISILFHWPFQPGWDFLPDGESVTFLVSPLSSGMGISGVSSFQGLGIIAAQSWEIFIYQCIVGNNVGSNLLLSKTFSKHNGYCFSCHSNNVLCRYHFISTHTSLYIKTEMTLLIPCLRVSVFPHCCSGMLGRNMRRTYVRLRQPSGGIWGLEDFP